MRGLKQNELISHYQEDVASFTDAWIETPSTWNCSYACLSRIFYRCVDWNHDRKGERCDHESHLLQMRGLKQACHDWKSWSSRSHLLQMRGLKHHQSPGQHQDNQSHLLQMRGLKLRNDRPQGVGYVASFTDAWIETVSSPSLPAMRIVASFTDAWIETRNMIIVASTGGGRIFYRCVDWNTHKLAPD